MPKAEWPVSALRLFRPLLGLGRLQPAISTPPLPTTMKEER